MKACQQCIRTLDVPPEKLVPFYRYNRSASNVCNLELFIMTGVSPQDKKEFFVENATEYAMIGYPKEHIERQSMRTVGLYTYNGDTVYHHVNLILLGLEDMPTEYIWRHTNIDPKLGFYTVVNADGNFHMIICDVLKMYQQFGDAVECNYYNLNLRQFSFVKKEEITAIPSLFKPSLDRRDVIFLEYNGLNTYQWNYLEEKLYQEPDRTLEAAEEVMYDKETYQMVEEDFFFRFNLTKCNPPLFSPYRECKAQIAYDKPSNQMIQAAKLLTVCDYIGGCKGVCKNVNVHQFESVKRQKNLVFVLSTIMSGGAFLVLGIYIFILSGLVHLFVSHIATQRKFAKKRMNDLKKVKLMESKSRLEQAKRKEAAYMEQQGRVFKPPSPAQKPISPKNPFPAQKPKSPSQKAPNTPTI
ncbi:unnamed protein product [Bursaphelenchus okinawaensis]|uniref:Uncharacterized protein n=1 Tax=Bursaphelenchus okinawaensis TaxID=465554 RepID=A0A811LM12_9BILA|nr:unnamed protein product [Bursaphelenchus okinawaensis]CAG9124172.1 unnamed protein product [Bursaphelenchus okinawaensis]